MEIKITEIKFNFETAILKVFFSDGAIEVYSGLEAKQMFKNFN